ncbi:hypothetical protein TSH100_11545 [Azospirillum sp. TSH100]|uniref:hypothetical protein n=1 Tax=Azospirillum sp. TSH100 TaxID=652764 RepID=UPI000D6151A0|nr:hypothetical protein [Azospirillum sp. TSH100]PWC87004.1 hypothetical protein TSH100_11545 [Azospirillum sp. TSH100]QCG91501.1 hypothetical protein E6C72_27340 [Azospirillum sp. TSH100]
MEIRGVSSTTAIRPTAFQPTEAGSASASRPADSSATGETEKASGAGYISPFLRYDQGARVAVLYFRDFDTGETQDQIPSQRVVDEYRRTASRLTQDDGRSAASKTGSAGSADGSSGGTGTSSGSGYNTAAGGSGSAGTSASTSVGVSFASASGSGGTTAVAGGTASATSGSTPAATGGGLTGGSPGGLVSVTV